MTQTNFNLDIIKKETVFGKSLAMWYVATVFELIFSIIVYAVYVFIELMTDIPSIIIREEMFAWVIGIIPYLVMSNFGMFIGAVVYYGGIRKIVRWWMD